MGGSITVLPAKRTWANDFTEALQPYLQMAFQAKLKQQLEDQQRQQSMQQAQEMFPDAFSSTLNAAGQKQYDFSKVGSGFQDEAMQQALPSIPSKYKTMAFNPENAQKYPGLGIDFSTGKMEYKVPSPDIFSQLANFNAAKGSGMLPEDMEITGLSGKNVNIGTDIPKKKFEAEQAEKEIQLKEKSNFIINQAQDSLSTIAEVKKGINNFGLTGQIPSLPGTQRYIWEANVNKLLSGKIIDLMTEMKSASKTGATGFGQLSEKEGQILREASTALKRGLPSEKALEYLNSMEIMLKKVIQNKSGQGLSQPQTDLSIMSDEELRRIASGG